MLVFDLESDGLLDELTRIHCINMIDRDTGERLRFNDAGTGNGTIKEALARLSGAPAICGHNIIRFDVPALQKLYPDFNPKGRIVDTLVDSQLIWTNLYDIDLRAVRKRRRPEEFVKAALLGRHSLEAWGMRLGLWKGDYAKIRKKQGEELGLAGEELTRFVWGTFNQDMDDYCADDVEVTLKLLEKIEAENYSEEARELEVRVAQIIFMQEQHGVLFDMEAARELEGQLLSELAGLEDQLSSAFPPWTEPVRKGGKPFIFVPKRDNARLGYKAGVGVPKFKDVVFNPGSRDHIASRLRAKYGWVPQELTPTGKDKVDETILEGLDYPEAKILARYLAVKKCIGRLSTGKQALIRAVRADGRIHGRVNSNGAVTGRMTHSSPNVNLPKVKHGPDGVLLGSAGGWGFEFRRTFTVPKGKKLVGCDADGLELRMLGHYMARYDDGVYARAVVSGDKSKGEDAHSLNQKAVGLESRDGAKTWMYGYLYGAGNWKLGFIHYGDMVESQKDAFNRKHPAGDAQDKALSSLGSRGRSRIETGLPALGRLQDAVKAAVPRGYIVSLDGRRIHIRAAHAALNSLLQSAGAVVMKKALVIAYDAMVARGWRFGHEFAFVLNVHDEFQIEVDEQLSEEVGAIAAEAIRKAGEHFNLRCPLAGSSQVGSNWAETH